MILIVLFTAVGLLSLYNLKSMSNLTRTIYDHPLVVSNASLNAKAAIFKMHSGLKELVYLNTFKDIEPLLMDINRNEKEVIQSLDRVQNLIIGREGKLLEKETRDLFLSWEPIRWDIIALIGNQKRNEARALITEKGAFHITRLEKKAQELSDYARRKATMFMGHAEEMNQNMSLVSVVILCISITLSLIVAFFTIRSVVRSEKSRLESETRFSMAFENANTGVYLVSPDGNLLRTNKKMAEILGYSQQDLESMTVDQITFSGDLNTSHDFMKKSLDGEANRGDFEKRFVHKTGRLIYGKVTSSLIRSAKGQPMYFISHLLDVTEKQRAIDALKMSEQRYALSQRIGGIGLWEWDIKENKVILSDETQIIMGMAPGTFSGGIIQANSFVHPDDALLWEKNLFQSVDDGKEIRMDIRLVRPDKTFTWVSVLGERYEDKDGNPERILGVIMDINQRKAAEKNQRELEKQLLQSQKMEAIGILAGGVAHDFNNLLSIILGYSEMLLEEIPFDHPHHVSLSEVHDASVRAQGVTRQLLAFGRKQVLEITNLDVNQVILGFEKLMRRVISEDIEFRLFLANEPLFVKADNSQVEQVLMNLVVNAKDSMQNGGILSIETSVVVLDEQSTSAKMNVTPGPYVVIALSDTGVGIDPGDLDRIYEPFFTTKEKDKGTGLGLATVYGIVTQHGGTIWAYSEKGHGTTFKIYLPQVRQDLLFQEEDPLIIPVKPPGKTLETILVVEDDLPLAQLTSMLLEKRGYRVILSESPEDAVEKSASHQGTIDLILTDVIMPGMKGPEVYEKVKETYRDVKVLYMSGYTANVITRHGVLKDGIQFIQKPFSKTMLLDKVDHVLRQKHS